MVSVLIPQNSNNFRVFYILTLFFLHTLTQVATYKFLDMETPSLMKKC